MARKGDGVFENLTRSPWPVGLVFGVIFFAVIRFGVPVYFDYSASPMLTNAGTSQGLAIATNAWIALIACWLASLISFISTCRRRRFLNEQRDLVSITATGR